MADRGSEDMSWLAVQDGLRADSRRWASTHNVQRGQTVFVRFNPATGDICSREQYTFVGYWAKGLPSYVAPDSVAWVWEQTIAADDLADSIEGRREAVIRDPALAEVTAAANSATWNALIAALADTSAAAVWQFKRRHESLMGALRNKRPDAYPLPVTDAERFPDTAFCPDCMALLGTPGLEAFGHAPGCAYVERILERQMRNL